MYMSVFPFSKLDTGFRVGGTCGSGGKNNPFGTILEIVFWQNSRYPSEKQEGHFVAVFWVLFFSLKFQSFPVPLLHTPQSPLLGGDGQRLWAGLLRLLRSCLLVAAARLEEVRVNEDFPKAAFIDNPTTYFLSFPVREI